MEDLVKSGLQFLVTGNSIAAALGASVFYSTASPAIKAAAVWPFCIFCIATIFSAMAFGLFVVVQVGSNKEPREEQHFSGTVFSVFGMFSLALFVVGIVATMYAVITGLSIGLFKA